MAEYIELENAIKRIKEYTLTVYNIDLDNPKEYAGRSLSENYCEGLYEATELLDGLSAAEVEPVKHGRWEGAFKAHCSNCGKFCVLAYIEEFPNYCPNCGAKMDGGKP